MKNDEQAYIYLKKKIIDGTYQPEHEVSENQIALNLNMSRTPIREAFRRLESEGLVKQQTGRKTIITGLNLEELKENYELRSMLESYALRKSFSNLDLEKLNYFSREFNTVLKKNAWNDYLDLDERFHCFLIQNEGEGSFRRILDILKSQTNRFRYAIEDDTGCMQSSVREIKKIITDIQQQDQEHAVSHLNEHIKNVYISELNYLQNKKIAETNNQIFDYPN
ncbi:GntR family transcriptional regulator [Pediococcus stilesii]|uniref:Transcriptional regulator n=1 Tax=Pediococcus stilesii TaxID=331679 RepID=A0A0R2KUN1_9LACO|nr:GntR family transcriptional regulator [Pediococcus stilesii]KRN93152.1 transcriptional regulator [Pediococcus stilesii]